MNRQLHIALRALCRHPHIHRSGFATKTALAHKSTSQTQDDAKQDQAVAIEDSSLPGEYAQSTDLPLEQSNSRRQIRVDTYLASLREQGVSPSVADIERFRPKRRPPSESSQYPAAYNALVERLCKSFTKDQLRRLGELYGLEKKWTRNGRRIAEYAASIMEKQWGWENLKEVERRKRDMTETTTRSFSLTASELFVLMGKDGSELLNLSNEYNVRVSVTPNPLSLQVHGLRGALKKLEPIIVSRKKEIVEETIELPSKAGLPYDLIPQVSRLANAYVENVGYKGKVRICAKDRQYLDAAKRVVLCIATYENHASRIPLLAYQVPAEESNPNLSYPRVYALYPFSPHAQVPWWMKVGQSYRLRHVDGWFVHDSVKKTESVSDVYENFVDISGREWSIEDIFLRDASGIQRKVFASTGHVLINDSKRQHASLKPPLDGQWDMGQFWRWLKEAQPNYSFVPSLPPLLSGSSVKQQHTIHRLIYRCLARPRSGATEQLGHFAKSKALQFEIRLDRADKVDTSQQSKVDNEASSKNDGLSEDLHDRSDTSENSIELPPTPGLVIDDFPTCSHKYTSEFLLCLPDRKMDLRLSVEDVSERSIDEFFSIKAYVESLKNFLAHPSAGQPDPPLLVQDGDDIYNLESNTTVGQKSEVSTMGAPNFSIVGVEVPVTPRTIHAVVEDILNLETNETSLVCEVHADNPATLEDLKMFLSDCDSLVNKVHRSNHAGSSRGDGSELEPDFDGRLQ